MPCEHRENLTEPAAKCAFVFQEKNAPSQELLLPFDPLEDKIPAFTATRKKEALQ
jgi:hypothetical protein